MAVHILPARGGGRDSQPTVEPGRIAVADMEDLIAAGEAQPLIEEFDVGPTFYQGIWWVVPEGEWDRGYTAAPEEYQREYSTTYLRLERAAQIVAVGQYADAVRARRIADAEDADTQELRNADRRADASARASRRAWWRRRPSARG